MMRSATYICLALALTYVCMLALHTASISIDELRASAQLLSSGRASFTLSPRPSAIAGAGQGLYVERGECAAGAVVCGYAALVLSTVDLERLAHAAPRAPSLLLRNRYILARKDGTLLDGNLFSAGLSRDLWRRAGERDGGAAGAAAAQVPPPLALGGRVNHATAANVRAVPVDVTQRVDPELHRWLRGFTRPFQRPGVVDDGGIDDVLRTALFVALRRIGAGEELLLDYHFGELAHRSEKEENLEAAAAAAVAGTAEEGRAEEARVGRYPWE